MPFLTEWVQSHCNHASMLSTITDGRKFSYRRPVLLTNANAAKGRLSAFLKAQQVIYRFTCFNNRRPNSASSSLHEAFIFVSSRILSKHLFNFRTEKERRWNEGETKVKRRWYEGDTEKWRKSSGKAVERQKNRIVGKAPKGDFFCFFSSTLTKI